MNNASASVLPGTQERSRSSLTAQLLLRVLELHPLLDVYHGLAKARDPVDFARQALAALDISVERRGKPLASLPAQGPLFLAANHPFGGVEGLVLAAWCAAQRPDLKILVNHMLCRIPELRPIFIPVDVFKAGNSQNIAGLRAALTHMEQGGALAVFPSGAVSHWHAGQRRVTDPEWNPLIGRLARIGGASVVPLYFEGRNSLLFQAAGLAHPLLRTVLLPHELWRMRGHEVRLHIGERVEPELLAELRDDKARTAYIRARCYALGRSDVRNKAKRQTAVATGPLREALLDEIHSLPRERILVEEGKYSALFVSGAQSPHILREIGCLREKTFRMVEEGSGKPLDLDRFDPYYTHLVLWDGQAQAIAGGYRMRQVFPTTSRRVLKTLYTASLFRFEEEFFERCGISMELGRAFVAPPYQREYAPLLMLWKGIGRLAAMAGTRTLFGPSSIGLGYAPESVVMLRQYLKECCGIPELASLVRGRRGPRPFSGPNAPDARGLEYRVLDRAVRGLEGDKGVPILFKHYLQLGGRIAAFHEDRKFGTLDALMVVDLTRAPEKLLLRYMGEERLRTLRLAHNTAPRS